MKCQDPTLCYIDGNNKKHFRSFSVASPIIKCMATYVFNCEKCIICRKRRSTELAARCVLHSSLYDSNCFLTLTYDEQREDYHNNFQYSDIQKFKKSLRRYVDYHYNKKIQIFNVHEYGKKGKKHWHLVVFNHDFSDKTLFTVKNGNKLYTSQLLTTLWPHGFNTIGDVTEASAMYQAQYTQKDFKNHHAGTAKKSHSKHSGIGRDYFLKNYKQILALGYIPFGKRKMPIPRYFQKLAHKHYSHFYEPDNFVDLPHRKKLYTRFKPGDANADIAVQYQKYNNSKQKKIEELTQEWEAEIANFIYNKNKTDFQKSAENYLYDLKNKNNDNTF